MFKQIDVILRVHRIFFRVYVDDIIVLSHTLEEHISHLHSVFQLFDSYEISLLFKKSCLNYQIVSLKQKIDIFGFIIAAEKVKTISKLNFPYTLKNLETYLKLTS